MKDIPATQHPPHPNTVLWQQCEACQVSAAGLLRAFCPAVVRSAAACSATLSLSATAWSDEASSAAGLTAAALSGAARPAGQGSWTPRPGSSILTDFRIQDLGSWMLRPGTWIQILGDVIHAYVNPLGTSADQDLILDPGCGVWNHGSCIKGPGILNS